MNSGPKFNNIKRNFATRNSMGFDEVINSLQDQASSIITNVTDNIYYIGFIAWSINDYLNNTEEKDRTASDMNNHFKIQNFFFTASFLLKDINSTGASGNTYIRGYVMENKTDTFVYNPNYIETLQTTMGYYRPGLTPLFLLMTETADGESLKYPHITPYGIELANVFENIIKNTDYFKKYRNSTTVPRSVLLELGNYVNLNMKNMPTLQKKLYEVLFDNKYNKDYLNNLSLDKDYLLYTIDKYKCNFNEEIRKILYDYYSPKSLNKALPKELENTAKIWEIIMGRQYFTIGLSMIWKHVLNLLDEPMVEDKWVEKVRNKILENIDADETLESLLSESNYTYEEREEMLKIGVRQIRSNLLVDGLKVMLSVYNRFDNRKDLTNYHKMFGINDAYDTIPLLAFFDSVKKHKKEKAVDYLIMIMKRLIIQNKLIGYKKLQRGKNGYYYEYNNGYYFKILEYEYDYAGNRMINVYRALEDLDLLGGVNNE